MPLFTVTIFQRNLLFTSWSVAEVCADACVYKSSELLTYLHVV